MENFFAKNLKTIREKKGLSQSELSRKTKKLCEEYNKTVKDEDKLTPITQASIARWEAGENSPSVDNLVLLKNALGVDLVDLIGKDFNSEELSRTVTLELFLNDTDYFDIENKIKSDRELNILQLLDPNDIILHVYSDKKIKLDKELCEAYEKNCEYKRILKELSQSKDIPKEIKKLISETPLKSDKNSEFMCKLSKVYLSIKKYYSKYEILSVIDRQASSEEFKEKYEKDERIKRIEKIFDNLLDKIDERENNSSKY